MNKSNMLAFTLLLSVCSLCNAATVRILTVFSPAAVSLIGSANLNSTAINEASKLNQIAFNSGIPATTLTFVSAGTFLSSSTAYDSSIMSAPVSLAADPAVKAARNAKQADLVIIIIGNSDPAARGRAYVGADAATAFAAVQQAALPFYSYSHEIGHLFGAKHQILGAENNDPTETTPPNGHGYTLGYQPYNSLFPDRGQGCVNDVMGGFSTDPRCVSSGITPTRANLFSNPTIYFHSVFLGGPGSLGYQWYAGNTSSNSSALIAARALAVSKFHLTPL